MLQYYEITSIPPTPTITKCNISMTSSYVCSLKVKDNTVVFMNAIKIYHLLYYNTVTVLLEYTDRLLQLVLHEYYYKHRSYYAVIMLNVFSDPICSILWWCIKQVSRYWSKDYICIENIKFSHDYTYCHHVYVYKSADAFISHTSWHPPPPPVTLQQYFCSIGS